MNYWVSRGGQQYGPYSLADLQRYVASGNILPTDMARSESMNQWLPVSQIISGGGAPAPQPPGSQPPAQPAGVPQNYGQASAQPGVAPQNYGQPPIYSQPPGAMEAEAAYVPSAYAMDYATWANRVIGYLIDSLFVGAAMLALYLLFTSMTAIASAGSNNLGGGMCCLFLTIFPLATLLVGLYNRVYLVSLRGYSVGQGVMKLKVVDANGKLLSQGTALIRLLAQVGMAIIPVLSLLDLLWPLWDERRQTLHDKAVNCYVINNAART